MYSFVPVGWWEVKLLTGRCSHFIKQQAFGVRNFLPMRLHLVKLSRCSSNTNTVLSPLWSSSDLSRFRMDIFFFPVIKILPALIHRLCLQRLVQDAVWITGLQQPTNMSHCMTSRWCARVWNWAEDGLLKPSLFHIPQSFSMSECFPENILLVHVASFHKGDLYGANCPRCMFVRLADGHSFWLLCRYSLLSWLEVSRCVQCFFDLADLKDYKKIKQN